MIFPYLRRLLETQKAAQVTKRRVDSLNEQLPPSAERVSVSVKSAKTAGGTTVTVTVQSEERID